MNNICFLFGHRNAPQSVRERLVEEVERQYEGGMGVFVVGNYRERRPNRYMVNRARTAVCYVWRAGNTRKLLERAKRRGMDVTNLAQTETHEI